MNKLGKAIKRTISELDSPNSPSTIYFHWDKAKKVWCLSGSTKSGLYWETDDVEADGIQDAREQAIEHLEAN